MTTITAAAKPVSIVAAASLSVIVELIRASKHRAAYKTWSEAGFPIRGEIIDAWLESGLVWPLYEAVEDVPAILDDPYCGPKIAHEIETDALLVAVHPPRAAYKDRWKRPSVLPDTLDYVPISAWYPGVVTRIGYGDIDITFADPALPVDWRASRQKCLGWQECWEAGWHPTFDCKGTYVAVGVYGERLLIVEVTGESYESVQ
jgi:hypothetical protein